MHKVALLIQPRWTTLGNRLSEDDNWAFALFAFDLFVQKKEYVNKTL